MSFPDVEDSISRLWIFSLNLIGYLDECHELIDINEAISILIHFGKDCINLFICYCTMSCLDDQLPDSLFGQELCLGEFFNIFNVCFHAKTSLDLVLEKFSQIF